MLDEGKLKRLARRLNSLADRNAERLREEKEVVDQRREGAKELHVICSNFVRVVNHESARVQLVLSPPEYEASHFRESGPNLFQITASGCIIQVAFEATESFHSEENYRKPYVMEGAVRWFNQESLEGLGIGEDHLFLCLNKDERSWEHFDPKTHHHGPFDEDYLADLLEKLLD